MWLASATPPSYPPLSADTRADVCVVGAGFSGLTTAYFLVCSGKSVVVVDRGPVAGGMSGRSTAHLTIALDDAYTEIERLHGADGARLAGQSHGAAVDAIAAIVAAERIDCDFERLPGYLLLRPDHDAAELERELDAARSAGHEDVHWVANAPLPRDGGPALCFPSQAQLHPVKYLAGLAEAIRSAGGRIHTGTPVTAVESGPPATVLAGGHVVTADAVVVATQAPINDVLAMHTKQAAYLTYVVSAPVPTGSVVRALCCDSEDPYHYLRITSDVAAGHDVLIVGGEDHRTGAAEDGPERHARVEAWARERFPMMGPLSHAWTGQILEPVDALGFAGPNPGDDDVYVVTGDSGNGITHATIGGAIITDAILGRPNAWADLYDPSRRSVKALATFARENAHTLARYADRFTPGDVTDAAEIPRGSGAVMRRGRRKLAVYRDEHGTVHARSAVCPHLGCVVAWNAAATTWDCPCHGSRFDAFGGVVSGPAHEDLERVDGAMVEEGDG